MIHFLKPKNFTEFLDHKFWSHSMCIRQVQVCAKACVCVCVCHGF